MLATCPVKTPVRFRNVLNFNWLVHLLLSNLVGKMSTSMSSLILYMHMIWDLL